MTSLRKSLLHLALEMRLFMCKRIVEGLLAREAGAVFATTDDPFVKRTPPKAGFPNSMAGTARRRFVMDEEVARTE